MSLAIGAIRSGIAGTEASGRIVTTDLRACAEFSGLYVSLMRSSSASAMSLLEHKITVNAHLFSCSSHKPQALVLDWDDEQIPEEVTDAEAAFDMIV